jgi:hypothetical protein
MVVAMVAGVTVVEVDVVDGGDDPFEEQPATRLRAAVVSAARATRCLATGLARGVAGMGSLYRRANADHRSDLVSDRPGRRSSPRLPVENRILRVIAG